MTQDPLFGEADHHFVVKTRVGGPPCGSNRRSLRPPFGGTFWFQRSPNWGLDRRLENSALSASHC
jgi:hypothetical protein